MQQEVVSLAPTILSYWLISSILAAGLITIIGPSHLSTHQNGEKGKGALWARAVLYGVFGGALLPLIVLISGAVVSVAIFGALCEKGLSK